MVHPYLASCMGAVVDAQADVRPHETAEPRKILIPSSCAFLSFLLQVTRGRSMQMNFGYEEGVRPVGTCGLHSPRSPFSLSGPLTDLPLPSPLWLSRRCAVLP
jgi:hypothetical protein